MAKNQMMGSTVMTPAERRRIAEEQKKRQKERTAKKNARINASEFANLGSATGMQKETNKARNEGRYANVRFKKGDADPKSLFKPKPKSKASSKANSMAAAAKTKRDITAKITAAEKKPSKTPSTKSRDKDGLGTKAKSTAKKYNVGVSKGGVSFGEAFKYYKGLGNKTFTWNGKKYTTEKAKAKPKASIKTPTPADFTATGKKAAPKKTASKDPRKGFASKATPGKAKAALPAGAKPFKGSYNSKTHKLQNIKGKTYVVPKGK